CRRAIPRMRRWSFHRMTTAPRSARNFRISGGRTRRTTIFERQRYAARTAQERRTMADFLGLMKQAAELKSKMEAMQAELDQIEAEGTSGGGLAAVKLAAKGEMKGVKIDDTLMQSSEKEILEDLTAAAHADARRKAETLLQEKMKSVAGGLPLPPGMKLF